MTRFFAAAIAAACLYAIPAHAVECMDNNGRYCGQTETVRAKVAVKATKVARVKVAKVRVAKTEHRSAHADRAGMVTVPTAAGIDITVAPSFAPKITAFIADLVSMGYKPTRIGCYATGGHVRGSLHYRGEACDFDQRGWNKTVSTMYRVSGLAGRHGLRDGCSFRDCGHVDSGALLARSRYHRKHYADAR